MKTFIQFSSELHMYIVEIVKDTFLQFFSAKMTIKAVVAFKIVSNFL